MKFIVKYHKILIIIIICLTVFVLFEYFYMPINTRFLLVNLEIIKIGHWIHNFWVGMPIKTTKTIESDIEIEFCGGKIIQKQKV